MSLLFADNFQQYGIGGRAYMLDGIWAQASNDVGSGTLINIGDDPDVNAPAGQVAVYINGADNYDRTVRKVVPGSAKSTVGCSLRLYLPQLPFIANNCIRVFSWRDINNAEHLHLRVETTGQLSLVNASGTVLATSSEAVTASAWHHIEAKITFSNTTGATEVRLNGNAVSALTLTNVDTVNTAVTTCSQIAVVAPYHVSVSFYSQWFRDFVIWDTAGSINNDFFGPCVVGNFKPTSDVSFNWTPSTGSTGYDLIDESGPPVDSDYISADVTQTTQSEFGLENLPADVTTVRGLMLVSRMWASDGGDCKIQMGVKSNGDQGLGTDRQITTAPTYWTDIMETSPDTGVQFTPTEFNAATFTIDRTL